MNLPIQPGGLTLGSVSYEEAVAEVRLGQTVIVGDGERFVLRGTERAVEGFARSAVRLGWAVVTRARLERRGFPT